MQIYCAGAIKGDISYQDNYKKIIYLVRSMGHTALSELNSEFESNIPLCDAQIYQRDIKWLESSHLMIAEISGASLGVGFEISYALFRLKKSVLALFSDNVGKVSAMIAGCNSKLLSVKKYSNDAEIEKYIKIFIRKNSLE